MNDIPIDKLLHFYGGDIICTVFERMAENTCLVSAAMIGALKEGYDAQGHGTPEFADFAATVLGAVFRLTINF